MHRPCYTFFCIRNVVIKTTFNFKFRSYDVILENQLGGIEIQMIQKWSQKHSSTVKLKATVFRSRFPIQISQSFPFEKDVDKKSRAKGEFKSLWETKSSDVCGI